MLSLLAGYDEHFGPLRILRYITFRTLLATGTAALIGFIIGPWLIARLRRLKFGQHYDDDRTGDLAHRFDKKNTPTMGGLLLCASVLGSSLLWAAPNVWVLVALFVYAALFTLEGTGLLLRRRWGELVTIAITGSFIPVELYETVHEPHFGRASAMVLNVVAVAYLVYRVRKPKARAPSGAAPLPQMSRGRESS